MRTETAVAVAAGVGGIGVLLAAAASRSDSSTKPDVAMEERRSTYKDTTGARTSTITNKQGMKLFCRRWEVPAKTQLQGIVIAIHGYTWTSKFFAMLAKPLVADGYSVWSFDNQGHGLSDGYCGIRGFLRRFDDYVDDAAQVLQEAAAAHPGVALYLFGESMGGAVVLALAQRLSRGAVPAEVASQVKGAILSGPAIRVSAKLQPPPAALAIAKLLAFLNPKMEVPDDTLQKTYLESFGDQEFAQASLSDPEILFCKPRMGAMLEVVTALNRNARRLEDIHIPLLVIHGTADTKTDTQYSEELIRRHAPRIPIEFVTDKNFLPPGCFIWRRASSASKRLVKVEGMRHQAFQDTKENTARVLQEIAAWLKAQA